MAREVWVVESDTGSGWNYFGNSANEKDALEFAKEMSVMFRDHRYQAKRYVPEGEE